MARVGATGTISRKTNGWYRFVLDDPSFVISEQDDDFCIVQAHDVAPIEPKEHPLHPEFVELESDGRSTNLISENTPSTYYVPEPEEFCLGFEFEAKVPNPYIPGYLFKEVEEWKKTIFQIGDRVMPTYEGTNIRVKHLDREDIESEGWTTDERRNGLGALRFELKPKPDPNEMTMFAVEPVVIYFSHQGYIQLCKPGTDEAVLQLRIKNITEFRKLMKQYQP